MSTMHVKTSTSCHSYGSSTDGSCGLAPPNFHASCMPPYCANKRMEIRRVINYHHVTAWQTIDTYLEANNKTSSKCGVRGGEI
jgi:hypothetical protein